MLLDYCKKISTYFPTGWLTPEQKKRQGWNAKNIERYLVLLFSLLGAGRGGDFDLSDKTKKPLWFSSKVDYRKFKCASDASMDDNVNLIRGFLTTSTLTGKRTTSFKLQQLRFLWRTPKS